MCRVFNEQLFTQEWEVITHGTWLAPAFFFPDIYFSCQQNEINRIYCYIFKIILNTKEELRGITIAHSSKIAKLERQEEIILVNEIKLLEEILPDNPDILDNLNLVKSKLNSIYIKRAAGYKVRSREKFIDLDERPSSYFLNQENKRAKLNNPSSLFRPDNTLSNDPLEILDLQEQYYKKLYEKRITEIENADLFINNLPTLTDDKRTDLESDTNEQR